MAESLVFRGRACIRVAGDQVCLTDLWREAGGDNSRRPSAWLRSAQARRLISHLESIHSQALVITKRGTPPGTFGSKDNGSTWAHGQLAIAYAQYLSPEFHAWCNEAITEILTKDGSPSSLQPENFRPNRVIYFAKVGQFVKIGVTSDLDKRISSLKSGNHDPSLELLATVQGDFRTEQTLHQRFRKYRRHGEWFRYEGALKEHIQNLQTV